MCVVGMVIMAALACFALAGCGASGTSGPFSNSGYALMIVVARQPAYSQPNCTQPNGTMLAPGDTVVDLGTMGTNCEEVAFVRDGSYNALGYLPVYGMRRAAGGVRCVADAPCNLRAGPDINDPIEGTLDPGASAHGYGTDKTGAVITDGNNYDWWEVVDPATGQRADVYGPNCQVF